MDLKLLIEKIRLPENSGVSQNKLATKYDVSRYLVKKALAEIAGLESDDEILDDPDSAIGSTENGCVSVKNSKASPAAVGDVWSWGQTNNNRGLITSTENDTIEYAILEAKDEKEIVSSLTQSCSWKNWKKKKNLQHVGINHQFLYCLARANEDGFDTKSNQVTILELYGDDFKQVTSAEYQGDPDELKNSSGAAPVSEDIIVEASNSDLKAITDVASNCPFRLVASTRSINIVDNEGNVGSVTADQGTVFQNALGAIKGQLWDKLLEICGIRKRRAVEYQKIMSLLGFKVEHGCVVMLDGTGSVRLGGLESVMKRIEQFASEGNETGILSLSKFVNRVLDNPMPDIMNRIIEFIRFSDVEIDEEGYVVAYKYVDSNYKDSYSRKLDNSPGSTVTMKRVLVDTNINNECSSGLHVCALSYVFQFWNQSKRLVKVRLSPRDIVAIPRDYKGAKIRCCRFHVLEDVTQQFVSRQIPVDFKGFFA